MVASVAPDSAIETVKPGALLVEGPAAAFWLASLFISTVTPELASVLVEPLPDQVFDQVVISAVGPTAAVQIRATGSAERRVHLPGRILQLMKKRHPDADVLGVAAQDDVMVSLRSFSRDCTLCMTAAEPQTCFDAFPDPPVADAVEGQLLGMSLPLLRDLLLVVSKVRGVSPDVTVLQQPWGLRLGLKGDDFEATVMLLGRRPTKGAAN